MFKPIAERIHPVGEGIQKIYRFKNDYGASVVRFKIPMSSFPSYGSYTDNENEWELAVIKFPTSDNEKFELTYETPLTDDVLGHLVSEEVEKTLKAISELEKN